MTLDFIKNLFKKKPQETDNDKIVVGDESNPEKAEGYNRLKDNVLYLNTDGTKKVIQVESAVAGEGKTTVTANLAVSLGLTDKKIVVLDLDFRRPKLHRKFGVSRDTGIAEYMRGDIEKKDAIKNTGYKNVDIITRGGNVYNPSLILTSPKFKALIGELKEEYDYVLLDCAPVLLVSDFIHISQVSDGVLFLVAYGSTTKNQVTEAVKELKKNGAKVLGTVFTKYDSKKDKYGEGYHYYYRKHYSENTDESLSDEKHERIKSIIEKSNKND